MDTPLKAENKSPQQAPSTPPLTKHTEIGEETKAVTTPTRAEAKAMVTPTGADSQYEAHKATRVRFAPTPAEVRARRANREETAMQAKDPSIAGYSGGSRPPRIKKGRKTKSRRDTTTGRLLFDKKDGGDKDDGNGDDDGGGGNDMLRLRF